MTKDQFDAAFRNIIDGRCTTDAYVVRDLLYAALYPKTYAIDVPANPKELVKNAAK